MRRRYCLSFFYRLCLVLGPQLCEEFLAWCNIWWHFFPAHVILPVSCCWRIYKARDFCVKISSMELEQNKYFSGRFVHRVDCARFNLLVAFLCVNCAGLLLGHMYTWEIFRVEFAGRFWGGYHKVLPVFDDKCILTKTSFSDEGREGRARIVSWAVFVRDRIIMAYNIRPAPKIFSPPQLFCRPKCSHVMRRYTDTILSWAVLR